MFQNVIHRFLHRNRRTYPLPFHESEKKIDLHLQRAFNIINAYLWFHGVGFTKITKLRAASIVKSIVSVFFVIVWEGNFLYIIAIHMKTIQKRGIVACKADVATLVIIILNVAVRIFYYTQRGKLEDMMQWFGKIFSDVCGNGKSMTGFNAKMVAMLLLNDFFFLSYVYYHICKSSRHLLAIYNTIPIPLSNSSTLYYFSYALSTHNRTHSATTAYFCTICFMLRNTLLEFKKKLRSDLERKHLIKLYDEILKATSFANDFLHRFILLAFFYFLSMEFQKMYQAVFVFSNSLAYYNVFFVLIMIINFSLICISSSSVIRAAAELKAEANKVSVAVTDPATMRFFLEMRRGLPAFKILDSIVIDSSLITTSAGVLLTYGMMLATFNGK